MLNNQNQGGLFEDQEMNFFAFPQNSPFPQIGNFHQSLNKPSLTLPHSLPPNIPQTLISSATKHTTAAAAAGGSHLLSLQTSAANLWAWGGEVNECLSSKRSNGEHLGISSIKMKKIKSRRKVRDPRFCFKTMSDIDVLDDGYKWRKYGQKVVKNTLHPRSYYRCTQDNCRVKKRVERLAEDPRMVITTYEGRHVHSPSHQLEDSQAQSHLNNFFF
ncbi:probable WRKY transcription factor 13 isoform X2 [Euphorbia lathyris]